jgi:hypothetical protein
MRKIADSQGLQPEHCSASRCAAGEVLHADLLACVPDLAAEDAT